MLEKIHSAAQSINSYIKPMGLSLSSKQQIITRTAMLALAVLHFPLIAAEASSESDEAFSSCIHGCTQSNMQERGYCIRDCMTHHLPSRW